MADAPTAGKFRPKKKKASARITPGATTTGGAATAGAAASAATAPSGAGGGRGGRGRSRSPSGRGGRGRSGRGRGRGGGGRGGRFVMPQGRAYFTGDQAKDDAQAAGGAAADAAAAAPPASTGSRPAASAAAAASASTAAAAAASSSARVIRPGASRSRSQTGPRRTGERNVGADNEGEETVLGEIEGGGVGGAGLTEQSGKAKSSLMSKSGKAKSKSNLSTGGDDLVDTDVEGDEPPGPSRGGVAAAAAAARGTRRTTAAAAYDGGEMLYTYDSDSTEDDDGSDVSGSGKKPVWSARAPARLPLPPPRAYGGHQHLNYECQRDALDGSMSAAATGPPVPDAVGSSLAEEKKGEDDCDEETSSAPVFLNLATASAQDRQIETDAWTVFKLPTRLPRIAPTAGVKSEYGGNSMMSMKMDPDAPAQPEQHQRYPGAPAPVGNRFDDSLRTAPAGHYGKIRIHQSGKAVLVIGEGTPEEVTLNLNEGIPCSMLQHAVNIDPAEAAYVNMGEVHHSIVATPDIEGAFV